LTVLTFPLLKLLSLVLSPFRDTHTIFVLARKKPSPLSADGRKNGEQGAAVLREGLSRPDEAI
jgi:hypothetical protein